MSSPLPLTQSSIRIISLNMGHGRGSRPHQLLVSKKGIQKNLVSISDQISHEQATIVALQEIDGPSLWSGSINHSAVISEKTNLPHEFRGTHVRMSKLDYGTAIISRYPLLNPQSQTFSPNPPLPNKGFVWADIIVKGQSLRVLSLHLDFAREVVRKKQLEEISQVIQKTNHPIIVMGDFNTEWGDTLQTFSMKHNLKAHPEPKKYTTFPKTKKELDWILISDSLDFLDYRVIPLKLSDHLAIVATIEIPTSSMKK